MFERYTEKARRVLFFARYEATRYASPVIETEHLLLGLLREAKALFEFFLTANATEDSFRKQIGGDLDAGKRTTADMNPPLSDECKRVLAYADSEADRMEHKLVAPEHLFLGLLCEESCVAARMLKTRGADIEHIREEMAASANNSLPAARKAAKALRRQAVPDAGDVAQIITGPLRVDLYKLHNQKPPGKRLRLFLWRSVQLPFLDHAPRLLGPLRVLLLRLFGAKIGPSCRVSNGVKILMPWNLTLGERSILERNTEIYNLASVEIGDHVVISEHSYLCTSTHDYTHPYFPVQSLPILIDSQVWVAAGCFVGPGITISEGAVIGAWSVVTKAMPAWMVCAGSPCKPLKQRVIRTV
jgi:acetyltransferase-like isoleucine patch superfamily enzyme